MIRIYECQLKHLPRRFIGDKSPWRGSVLTAFLPAVLIILTLLWFDNGLMLRVEGQEAGRRPIQAQAYFAIGSRETQATTGAPMVQQLKQFTKKLEAQGNSGLSVTLDVRDGETHESIFPGAVTRGLEVVFQDLQRTSAAAATSRLEAHR